MKKFKVIYELASECNRWEMTVEAYSKFDAEVRAKEIHSWIRIIEIIEL